MPDPATLLRRDLDEIVAAAETDFARLRGARVFVTGGTGFFGGWLLRAIVHANRRAGARVRVDALTRDPAAAAARLPDLAAAAEIRFVPGDLTAAPVAEPPYDAVVHAAAAVGPIRTPHDAARTLATEVDGARCVIRSVLEPSGSVPVLFTSSGAVYGRAPAGVLRFREADPWGPDVLDVRNAYHEGKRVAELALATASASGAGSLRVARLFAFLGPGLPLDDRFAAGNFVRDALRGGAIAVAGDGTALRSYLYPTDMVAWCLRVLVRGAPLRAYNVGSPHLVSIRELAERIAGACPGAAGVTVANAPADGAQPSAYAPDPARIVDELGVRLTVDLDEAIARTLAYHRAAGPSAAPPVPALVRRRRP